MKLSASASRHFRVEKSRTYLMNLDFICNKPLIIRLTDACLPKLSIRRKERASEILSPCIPDGFGAMNAAGHMNLMQA